jgi:hypothetical protein
MTMAPYHWRQPERPFAAQSDIEKYMPWLKKTSLWERIKAVFQPSKDNN